MDDELDQILNKRMTPPRARSGLADQIVQRALEQETASTGAIGWFNQLASVFRQNFMIPQPGVAFAVVLLFGLWVGMSFESDTTYSVYNTTDEELAYTFIVDDGLNAEEWL